MWWYLEVVATKIKCYLEKAPLIELDINVCVCQKLAQMYFIIEEEKKTNNSASGDIVIYVNFIHLKLEKDIN